SIKKDGKSAIKESSENIIIPTKNKFTQFDTLVKKQNNYSNTIASASLKPKDLMDQFANNPKHIIDNNNTPILISNRTENNVLFASKNKVSMELMKLFKPSLIANLEDEYNRTIKGKVSNTIFIDELLQRQLYFVKGFHIGVKGEFNNTWILVTQPSSITKAQSTQINYKIDAGLAYGFLAGYDFNNKFGLQIEYHLVSQIAQRYEVTSQYTIQDKTTRLKLNYSHIPLLFKFKWHPLKGVEQKPVVMDYMIGVQYGWLKSNDVTALSSTTEGGNSYIKKQVNLTEWDLVGGVNYDIYLNQNFFLSMGGRATYGSNLRNFFNTNSLQKSRNVTIGIEMGLHYKLPFGKKVH
ncbi:MAG: outer membrane protein beta-barrel domain, partial [Bacteroidota bacterium]